MNNRHRIAHFAAVAALCAAATIAQAAIEPCVKNHYILDEPCAMDWAAVNNGLTDRDVHVVAIDPVKKTTLYAGGPSGLFKSVNGGAAWSETGLILPIQTAASYSYPRLPAGFTTASAVAHLAIDAADPNTLYAGTIRTTGCVWTQRRLFKSSDGGESWTDSVSPGINGCDNIHSLVLGPTDPPTLYLTNFDGVGDTWSPVIKSTDGAASWTYIEYPILNVLAVDPVDSRTVYAGTFGFEPSDTSLPNGVLKSRDGGGTWATTGLTGSGITALTVDSAKPRTLYAATVSGYNWAQRFKGLFKSVDGGTTWTAVSNGLGQFLGTSSSVSALIVDSGDSNNVYLGMSAGGIFRSIDGGASWTPFSDGLQSLTIRSLALVAGNPNTLYAGTPSGVFKITDVLPVLALDAPRPCVGAPWTVRFSRGVPNTAARLYGTTNGEGWEWDWLKTDADGSISESGVFAAEGKHTLRVQAGGALSNSISFSVSSCPP